MGEFADYIRKKFGDYVKGGDKEEEDWYRQFPDDLLSHAREAHPGNYRIKREWERRQKEKPGG